MDHVFVTFHQRGAFDLGDFDGEAPREGRATRHNCQGDWSIRC